MTELVTRVGIRPVDYWSLTVRERAAIIAEYNRAQRQRSKK